MYMNKSYYIKRSARIYLHHAWKLHIFEIRQIETFQEKFQDKPKTHRGMMT